MNRKLTSEQHAQLLQLRADKVTFPRIAEMLGIHHETAKRYARMPVKIEKQKPESSGVIAGPVYARGYRTAILNLYSPAGRRYAVSV